MAKTIIVTNPANNKTYTLEFTRKSASMLEASGFRADELSSKPVSMIPMLFAGAFLANHRDTKRTTIENIYDKMSHKDELISALVEMYSDTITSLMAEPEDGDEGNPNWKMGA